jgi:hypothetical protein
MLIDICSSYKPVFVFSQFPGGGWSQDSKHPYADTDRFRQFCRQYLNELLKLQPVDNIVATPSPKRPISSCL